MREPRLGNLALMLWQTGLFRLEAFRLEGDFRLERRLRGDFRFFGDLDFESRRNDCRILASIFLI